MAVRDVRNEQIGVRLPVDMVRQLDAIALRETRNRSNLIVHLLRLALAGRDEGEPRVG
jgi:metal-responsive CopG/Arc/MetJ family transcriptional regulator